MTTTRNLKSARSTGTNRQVVEEMNLDVPDGGLSRSLSLVAVLTETFDHADFTDGGAAVGTIQFDGALPSGAVILGTKVLVPEGFAGDTSAALTIGDGSDADRYNTSTVDVFTTAATGVQSGVPSGNKLIVTENRPTLTVTTAADWGSVTAGQVTVSIYYLQTA